MTQTQPDPQDTLPKGDGNRRDWWNLNSGNPNAQLGPAREIAKPPNAAPLANGANGFRAMVPPQMPPPRAAEGDSFNYTFAKRGMSPSEKRLRIALVLSQIALGVVVLAVIAVLTRRVDSPAAAPAVIVVTATPTAITHMVVVLPTSSVASPTSTPTQVAAVAPTSIPTDSVNLGSDVSTDVTATVAVLPCRKFTFLPGSAVLTQESRDLLNQCVLPALQERGNLYLQVRGSAAWPGPKGAFTEEQIRALAQSRAQAIVDYLISQKIDPARFLVQGVAPPEGHREIDDPVKQAEDRWVEMTLITGGR